MKHDVTPVLIKHINELFQILEKYNVSDKSTLVSISKADLVFQKAVLMSVGYIGELSKKVNDFVKQSNPNVNWRRLGTSRNIIFHDYDIVDMEIIASVIFKDISELRLIKKADSTDIPLAFDFIDNVFSEFVAPDYSEQGKNNFKNSLKDIFNEATSGSSSKFEIWICCQNGKIIGVISTKDITHISLMFVNGYYHKKGVARYMLNFVLNRIRNNEKAINITVNSSPYAVKAYECLGFVKRSEQQEKDGIIFIPMILTL